MGRPRLYHSPEEKTVANRLKSKKHYEKKKRSINKKRRREYACAHPAEPESKKAMPQKAESATSAVDPLTSWLEAVERIRRGLKRTIGDAPQDYVEEICLEFLKDREKDRIYEKIVKLGKLQKSIYRYHTEVYALAGVGAETDRANVVLKDIGMVLSWVEEVFCYAMVDFQEVQERYVRQEFMFQSK